MIKPAAANRRCFGYTRGQTHFRTQCARVFGRLSGAEARIDSLEAVFAPKVLAELNFSGYAFRRLVVGGGCLFGGQFKAAGWKGFCAHVGLAVRLLLGSQANVTDRGGALLADKRNIRALSPMKVRLTFVAAVLVTKVHVSKLALVWT